MTHDAAQMAAGEPVGACQPATPHAWGNDR